MLNPTQESLDVKNSSEQTGVAQQTSLYNQQFIEEAVQMAAKLQKHINSLYKIDFVKDLYMDEVVESDSLLHKITDTLSDILGRAYLERIMKEEGV